jgi:hypothetical protein
MPIDEMKLTFDRSMMVDPPVEATAAVNRMPIASAPAASSRPFRRTALTVPGS